MAFQPLASSTSSGDRAAAAAQESAPHSTQSAADAPPGTEESAAAASGDSAEALDPMQDIIKKAVQSQVAALSEVRVAYLPLCCPLVLLFFPSALLVFCVMRARRS